MVSRRTAAAQWLVLCAAHLVSVASLKTLTTLSFLTCRMLMGGCLWYESEILGFMWSVVIDALVYVCEFSHKSNGMLGWDDCLHVRWSVVISANWIYVRKSTEVLSDMMVDGTFQLLIFYFKFIVKRYLQHLENYYRTACWLHFDLSVLLIKYYHWVLNLLELSWTSSSFFLLTFLCRQHVFSGQHESQWMNKRLIMARLDLTCGTTKPIDLVLFCLFTGWWQARARLLRKGLWYCLIYVDHSPIRQIVMVSCINNRYDLWPAVFLGLFTSINYIWRHSYVSGWDILTERKWRYIHLCWHRSIYTGNQGVLIFLSGASLNLGSRLI